MDSLPPGQRLALALHRATALVDRVADAYLQPAHGITVSAFRILITIQALQPTRQSDIARALDVSRASVTQRLSALTGRGWVEVTPDPADSRAHTVSLSPTGTELLTAAWAGLDRSHDGLENGVDLAALEQALDTLAVNARRHLSTIAATGHRP